MGLGDPRPGPWIISSVDTVDDGPTLPDRERGAPRRSHRSFEERLPPSRSCLHHACPPSVEGIDDRTSPGTDARGHQKGRPAYRCNLRPSPQRRARRSRRVPIEKDPSLCQGRYPEGLPFLGPMDTRVRWVSTRASSHRTDPLRAIVTHQERKRRAGPRGERMPQIRFTRKPTRKPRKMPA
jgi:hypothetical protein